MFADVGKLIYVLYTRLQTLKNQFACYIRVCRRWKINLTYYLRVSRRCKIIYVLFTCLQTLEKLIYVFVDVEIQFTYFIRICKPRKINLRIICVFVDVKIQFTYFIRICKPRKIHLRIIFVFADFGKIIYVLFTYLQTLEYYFSYYI